MPVRRTSRKYLERLIRKKTGQAIHDYRMIEQGHRVVVAVSGGKDSIVMMQVLACLREAAPLDFELIPVHVHSGFEQGFEGVREWIRRELGYEVMVRDGHISEILRNASDPDKSPCALCSRLRRGNLYGIASELGAHAIALGHHMDDIVETFLLRSFYTGQLGSMAPARVTDDGTNRIIRPLAYCTSELVEACFAHLEVEPVAMTCPARQGSRREFIRDCIKRLERDIPWLKHSIFASLGNIDTKSLCVKENAHADPD
jgi:tRNA 2-thiocytidine biosynthesis protein TtcA